MVWRYWTISGWSKPYLAFTAASSAAEGWVKVPDEMLMIIAARSPGISAWMAKVKVAVAQNTAAAPSMRRTTQRSRRGEVPLPTVDGTCARVALIARNTRRRTRAR